MKSKNNKTIGITLGDPCGIGPEITAKALSQRSIAQSANFVIIGDYFVFKKFSVKPHKNLTFLDVNSLPVKKYKLGQSSQESGKASLDYLNCGIELIKNHKIDALVTAPLSKEAVCFSEANFHGHTEYLANAFNIKQVEMLFVHKNIRTIIATRHIPVQLISQSLTKDQLLTTIAITHKSLKTTFNIKQPRIALCGLNPHAGEGGRIGAEEITTIIPAVQRARKNKIDVYGPFAADTLFIPQNMKKFDVIIAMYHDQGLGPVKALFFPNLVNVTIGLPFIRTSTAHGTAFDIAPKKIADPASMIEAIQLAVTLSPS